MKCKRGNEWDMSHTAITQCVSAIVRSTQLPVSREILLSILTPPTATYSPPPGRMDLIITSGDFQTLLADVTITHPHPSSNQRISQNMMTNGYSAAHREHSKITKYSPAAQTLGAQFVPLVLESYGKFGSQFTSFLKHMSREFFNRCWK